MKRLILLLLALTLLFVGCTKGDNTGSENHDKDFSDINFSMVNEKKETVQLNAYLDKPVVLNFWASWCAPCKAEMPAFNEAYLEYGEEVNFLMVSVDSSMYDAINFMKGTEYQFPYFHDTYQQGSRAFDITSIPRTFFISTSGEILESHTGKIPLEELENKIQLLKEDFEASKDAENDGLQNESPKGNEN